MIRNGNNFWEIFVVVGIMFLTVGIVPLLTGCATGAKEATKNPADEPAPPKWPTEVKTVWYHSSADNTFQPAVFYSPETGKPVPLLVGLHTWSADYKQANTYFIKGAKDKGWAMICPDFRGSNTTSSACGSDLAVADIVSAVEYMKNRVKIDPDRIYLMGMSGGGYASMLMAGRHPEIWAGVCSWVGISDLAAWHAETKSQGLNYSKHLEAVCGGAPGDSSEIDKQYRHRSAKTWLHQASGVPLCINHGIHDGHRKSSVPVSQSINAYNILAEENKRLSTAQIQYICQEEKIPPELQNEKETDPLYGLQVVLFRRSSKNVRITIFEGGHGGSTEAGIEWLSKQCKNKAADWSVADSRVQSSGEIKAGK
ncbi:MAG: alpha/beta fold hydrolase [Kiritimatiellae bacterium]|nr:alpha/beta fold hydrolase [Kiritimatiellia bacterium]MDD5519267.1 alpha/beta fold hydrolase [Kiritimatiellia bacterium]